MLAPLKERSVQECDGGAPSALQADEATAELRSPVEEMQDLRRALRESRTRLRRSALASTRQIAALNNEVGRLSELCADYRRQLARFESGVAIVELGCKLMQLSAEKDVLDDAVHRVWTLERTIEAAHVEYVRLSQERDALAQDLCLSKLEQIAVVRS
jgi:hypothetical protein